MSSVTLVKYFKLAVASMRDTSEGPPYFYIGHRKDVNGQLKDKNRRANKDQKYPAIVLPMDINYVVEDGFVKYDISVWLLGLSKDAYTTEKRLELVFTPVLQPLYANLMKALVKSIFQWSGDQVAPPHNAFDRYYIGTQNSEGNNPKLFDDPLDAIEIRDLKLNIPTKICLP